VNPGRGYAAGMDLWITPKAGLSTSSTPAWTTLRVAHIPPASATAAEKVFILKY